MTARNDLIQEGAPVVEIIDRTGARPVLGDQTTVVEVFPSYIRTADRQLWDRLDLFPVREGRNSARRLASELDPKVVLLRAQTILRDLSEQARNLSRLERRTPQEVVADLDIFALMASKRASQVRDMVNFAREALR